MTTRETRAMTQFAAKAGKATGYKFIQSNMTLLESGSHDMGEYDYVMFEDKATSKQWQCRLTSGKYTVNEYIPYDPTAETTETPVVEDGPACEGCCPNCDGGRCETVENASKEDEQSKEETKSTAEVYETLDSVVINGKEHKIVPMPYKKATQTVEKTEPVALTIVEKLVLTCVPFSQFYESGFDSQIWIDTLCKTVKEMTTMSGKHCIKALLSIYNKGYITEPADSFTITTLGQQWYLAQTFTPDYNGLYSNDDLKSAKSVIKSLINTLKTRAAEKAGKPVENLLDENGQGGNKAPKSSKVPIKDKKEKKAKKAGKKSIARSQEVPELKPGEVLLKAFTGMVIGVFPVSKKTKKYIEIETNRGTLRFDAETLKQLNSNKPKFANRIEVK